MSVNILHGECLSLNGLNDRLGTTVTRSAKGNEILQVVGCFVVSLEKSIWPYVVYLLAGTLAVLTYPIVAFARLAFLCLPIRAAISAVAVDVLRVKGANAVGVSAGTRAVFSCPGFSTHLASIKKELRSTP